MRKFDQEGSFQELGASKWLHLVGSRYYKRLESWKGGSPETREASTRAFFRRAVSKSNA